MNDSTHLSSPGLGLPGNEQFTLQRTNAGNGVVALSHNGYGYDRGDEQGSHLKDYWRVIRKHLWLIIGMTLLIPTLVAIFVVRKPDVYEAQARVQVDLENANPLLGGMSKNSSVILSNETNDPAYFNTQLQILTGPGLLRRVAKSLDLEHNRDFRADPTKDTSTWSSIRKALGFRTP